MELSSQLRSERREASVVEIQRRRFKNVDEFEVQSVEECDFGRGGVEVGMNECEFVIGITLEIEEFKCEVMCDVLPL